MGTATPYLTIFEQRRRYQARQAHAHLVSAPTSQGETAAMDYLAYKAAAQPLTSTHHVLLGIGFALLLAAQIVGQ